MASPITAERAASASVRLGEVFVTRDEVTWLGQRPDEAERYVVMRSGHGFRKAENVACALQAELAFYGRILGFDPADDLPPLEIWFQPGT